jgi:hypothetical protein
LTGKIRYLLDENISRTVRNQLLFHEPTMDVACVGDENAPPYGAPDSTILEWIEQTGYILVSRNRRTMPIHLKEHLTQNKHIPGMLLLKKRMSMGELIEELQIIWHASEPEEYHDHIRYLPL